MGEGVTFVTARALVDLLGRLLERRHGDIATMERRINQRGNRVYIDTGQTGRSRTIVSPYSVRAQRGATVSTPLDWEEVNPSLAPAQFTMSSVPLRVEVRADPMRPLLDQAPDVAKAVKKLAQLVSVK
jgi:bifunctional non-homologous end joining protein LigD